jgi:hypothetical protein
MTKRLMIYNAFHLNLAYSSIEEEQRPEVIRKCYWPLLRIARKLDIPLGIEAPGYTLETINAIDPSWISELKKLTLDGKCEFIGSGYSQLIGPLVPSEVNAANLAFGHQVYEELLGFMPQVALINEQAYSSGLLKHYLNAGYKAIMMDWDNPASSHPEWTQAYRYLPQKACDQYGTEIPLIWTNSIAFQKFQRYAHGEMDLDEYLNYLSGQLSEESRTFPLYCNDIEIFNFRPGRYETEANIIDDEWFRIEQAFESIINDERFTFIAPSQVLDFMNLPGAANALSLETSGQPLPVKKQSKYNVTRWAVTGRNDLAINTYCWRIYEALLSDPAATDDDWKELCYLWSSDFRTHITAKRWEKYLSRLDAFADRVNGLLCQTISNSPISKETNICHFRQDRRFFVAETPSLKVVLNCAKGLCLEALWIKPISENPLIGTLHHGYYNDINWGADYYTGHLIFESPGRPRITDLSSVEPIIEKTENGIIIRGVLNTSLGPVYKKISIPEEGTYIKLDYFMDWNRVPVGSLRIGNLTLNPQAFDRRTLFYRTQNGGSRPETFLIGNHGIDHGKSVSYLVSASTGLGLTGEFIEIGDASKHMRVEIDKSISSPLGLITCKDIGDTYFCRLAFSLLEGDETCRPREDKDTSLDVPLCLSLKISGANKHY